MEEITKLHSLNLEWGCITNLVDKISNIEDGIEGGWDKLIDMVADAMTAEAENKDPASAFFNLYQFLFRLYYRLKTNPEVKPFNQYYEHGEEYWVSNYNYEMLRWAMTNGFASYIDNSTIRFPKEKLNDKQQRAFERRCEKGAK